MAGRRRNGTRKRTRGGIPAAGARRRTGISQRIFGFLTTWLCGYQPAAAYRSLPHADRPNHVLTQLTFASARLPNSNLESCALRLSVYLRDFRALDVLSRLLGGPTRARMSFLANTPLAFLSRNSRNSSSSVQSDADPETKPASPAAGTMAQRMLDERAAEPALGSAISKVLPWTSTGSADEQADAMRGKLSYQVRKDRILLVCMAIEDEKVTLVQQHWRSKVATRSARLQHRSATKLQARMRGKLTRRDLLPEHKVSTPDAFQLLASAWPPAPLRPGQPAPAPMPPAPAPWLACSLLPPVQVNILRTKRAARKIQQYIRLALVRLAAPPAPVCG